MAKGDTKTNQYLDIAANGTRADLPTDTCCETRSQTLIREVAERIMDVEDEVEELKNNPDVVDIVATYADLQAYDTQHLTDKDIIRVLQDETHDGESTYYRYNKQSDTWTYVGTVGDYYTKTAADAKFQDKLTAGDNITIEDESGALVISATDTTYSNFTGTDGTTAGTAGLVPAPTTTDGDKYLKGDGTWGTVQAGSSYTAGDGINISAQDVISATNTGKARVLTTADYNWPTTGTKTSVALWLLEPGVYTWEKSNGPKVDATLSDESISAYGYQTALVTSSTSVAVSIYAFSNSANASMFYQAYPPTGERLYRREFLMSNSIVDNLTSTANTKVLSANQGKVLKDLVDSLAIRATGAPTTSTVGQVGTLYEDTTNGKLYQCTAVSGNTYTWTELGSGGGGGITIKTLDAHDYNPAGTAYPTDPLGQYLIDIGAQTGDIYRITNGNLYANLGTMDSSSDKIFYSNDWYENDFIYILAVRSIYGGGYSIVFLEISTGNNYSAQNPIQTVRLRKDDNWYYGGHGTVLTSEDLAGYNSFPNADNSIKALRGDAADSIVKTIGYATNISGLSTTTIEHPSWATTTPVYILEQTMWPGDIEWMGTFRLVDEFDENFDFENAPVGSRVGVWARDFNGVPLTMNVPEGTSDIFEVELPSGGNIQVKPGGNNDMPLFQPSMVEFMSKGEDGWNVVAGGNLATILPRTLPFINGGTTAPTTATVGAVGTQYTYVDTTGTHTAHLCVCTEIDTTDPSTPVYTWQTLI